MDNNQKIMFEELKKKGWNTEQLYEQLLALEKGVTLIDLDPTKWNVLQMQQQLHALENGVTLIDLDPDKWTWQQMDEQRLALKNGVTLIDLDPDKWTWQQMGVQRRALENGVTLIDLDPTKWNDLQMEEQRLALEEGFDISHLDPTKMNWKEMEKYRWALKTNNNAEKAVSDFIYSVDNSNKIKTVCDNCDSVAEFFSTSLKIESSIFLKVVAVDNPSTELLKIERNTKNEFWVRINIVNNEGEDFITNIKIKTKTDLAKSVSTITDFMANIQAFSKYVDDLSELI